MYLNSLHCMWASIRKYDLANSFSVFQNLLFIHELFVMPIVHAANASDAKV